MKTSLSLLLTLSIGVISYTAVAETVLQIPDSVDILAINAKQPEMASGLFPSDKETLKNGVNQIVFKYSPAFEIGEDIRHAYSPVIIAKFAASDTNLHFKLPSYRSLTQAREEIGHMKWTLVDDNGNNVVLAEDTLHKNGIQVGRDYAQEAQNYNAGSGIAAIHSDVAPEAQNITTLQQPVKQHHSVPVATPSAKQAHADTPNVTQLKRWYQKATEQERKVFRKWIIDQE
ncbi:DUF2057 family protein [Vibrio mangrovi]|uniref:UPF0319 protein SBX37_00085 n=1 Tax=Vibrio mangrovi TaxID=474394 RepID=A0A1Y6IVZ7_9VIBR|nr:DUF2057 family protein [Vibrio mangrovi]MDW6001307.1 DUF2057 family protein [Vibrio mangrovi]SMS00672.1 hypothetical protein VIM7927_01941 [Vibrio mangrovi]